MFLFFSCKLHRIWFPSSTLLPEVFIFSLHVVLCHCHCQEQKLYETRSNPTIVSEGFKHQCHNKSKVYGFIILPNKESQKPLVLSPDELKEKEYGFKSLSLLK